MSTESAIARFVQDEELDGFSAGQLLEVTKATTLILSIPPAATSHVDAVAVATSPLSRSGGGPDFAAPPSLSLSRRLLPTEPEPCGWRAATARRRAAAGRPEAARTSRVPGAGSARSNHSC